ncbi:hypothetical protein Tco_1263006 [Tanacetum coccineum]
MKGLTTSAFVELVLNDNIISHIYVQALVVKLSVTTKESLHPELPGPEEPIVEFSGGQSRCLHQVFRICKLSYPHITMPLHSFLVITKFICSKLSVIGQPNRNRVVAEFAISELAIFVVAEFAISELAISVVAEFAISELAISVVAEFAISELAISVVAEFAIPELATPEFAVFLVSPELATPEFAILFS